MSLHFEFAIANDAWYASIIGAIDVVLLLPYLGVGVDILLYLYIHIILVIEGGKLYIIIILTMVSHFLLTIRYRLPGNTRTTPSGGTLANLRNPLTE